MKRFLDADAVIDYVDMIARCWHREHDHFLRYGFADEARLAKVRAIVLDTLAKDLDAQAVQRVERAS